MGGLLSSFAAPEAPPSVVLVPPLLDRERKGRSRFAKSSYDTAFAQAQLRSLFSDYVAGGKRASLFFSPPEDERVSVTAKLKVPEGGEEGGGALSLRFQPADTPYSFVDIKTRVQGASSSAVVRGCAFDPSSKLAAFAQLPLLAANGPGEGLIRGDEMRLGLRFTSPGIASGCILSRDTLYSAWAVGRLGSLVVGMQTAPAIGLDSLLASMADCDVRQAALQRCQLATSCAIAYRGQQSACGGGFTAVVEIQQQTRLSTSFMYHTAIQRNVRNPFEAEEVVGITNYCDLGVQVTSDLAGKEPSSMRLGAQWQANKNLMVKARVGLDGAAASVIFRSWLQPSTTVAIGMRHDYRGGLQNAQLGVSLDVGSFKSLRYERSPEAQRMSGERVTQRHMASAEDEAYHKGRGLLVPLSAVDDPEVLGQAHPAGADYL